MLQHSSIFRERRSQCSPCFEIWELFGANLSILLELIANSTPVCILNFGQITQMTFQNGSCGCLQQLILLVAITHSDHQLCRAHALHRFSSIRLRACWQDRTNDSRKQACTHSSDSAWFYVMLPKT